MIAGASRLMSEAAFAAFVTWWVTATLVAVIFGVHAAVVPAIRASRMKVLDAIASE